MVRAEIERGLAQGRTLVQEEWARCEEIACVDGLVAEGKAVATPWEYQARFQCERRIITGARRHAG